MMQSRVVIFEVLARPLYALIVVASLWVLLRGHNEPGGGFIGGLIAVSASVLWAVARGSQAARQRLPMRDPVNLAVVGVGIAAISGLPALWAGQDFLTHWWFTLPLGFTDFKLSTVLLFDLGVYLAVWGSLSGYAMSLLALDETIAEERS